MTRTPTALVVVAAATGIVLAGCGTGSDAAAPAATTPTTSTTAVTSAAGSSSADPSGAEPSSTAPSGSGAPGRCTAADVTPSLGAVPAPGGQLTIPLRYTNSGSAACTLAGYPGATLQGPDQVPYGPQYQLARGTTTPSSTITLAPGQAAEADLTLGTVAVGDPSGWQPTELLTIAPGDTTVMTVPFPAGTPVSRQDGATHPASYVGVFTGPVA